MSLVLCSPSWNEEGIICGIVHDNKTVYCEITRGALSYVYRYRCAHVCIFKECVCTSESCTDIFEIKTDREQTV